MRPYHPPRPNHSQPHRPRPGDPGAPPLPAVPMHPQLNPATFPPPVPNLAAAANPMVAAAAANPFIALQLFGQAQQLQNLGFLAAAALQQQQQPPPPPFFPGGFPPNPNQFGAFPGPHGGFSGGGAFRPGGVGVGGPRPPRPMMGAAGKGCNGGGGGVGPGAPRPALNVGAKDLNSSGGSGGEVNHAKSKSDGISHFASENGERNNTTDRKARFNPGRDERNNTTDRKARFNPGRDGRDGRQFGPSGGRGKGRPFNQGRGRGSNNWREVKSNFKSSDSPASGARHSGGPASGGRQKRPPIFYDANEVKQWLEARKKNYPTTANINKKLSQSQLDGRNKDEEAQMHRRELKEVLAKQKELGFELPELPPGYLSETEDQVNEGKSKRKTQHRDCHFGNRTDKIQKYDRRDFQSKRPRVQNHTHHDDGAMLKSREPTLLKKLLSSDIKRDRHRLLHTFKFMVLNNFFRDWPDKPLEFPSVKVNQIELESNIAAEDLDGMQNAETTKGNVDFKENGDKKDSSSSDGESGSGDNNEDDGDDVEGACSERSDKDRNEDADAEQCNASEEDFSAPNCVFGV